MPRFSTLLARLGLCVSLCLSLSIVLPAQEHDADFWRGWLRPDAQRPAPTEVTALVGELDEMLTSPDPVQRDEIAFSLLARWIYRDRCVELADRRRLLARWQARLGERIENADADAVAARSFAALSLSLLVALDNEAPFLDAEEFASLHAAATRYLRDEPDVRGLTESHGWLHSVAHTADLLKFLLRSRHLTADQQVDVLNAIGAKLQSVDVPLAHGEPERIARAVIALLLREDLARPPARSWLASLRAPLRGEPTAAQLIRQHNQTALLAQIHLLLSAETRDDPAVVAARALVLESLRGGTTSAQAEPAATAIATAAAADVASIDAIVRALYASISGAAGEARDWQRVRSLFHRHHRMLPIVRGRSGLQAVALSIDDYVRRSGPMLERDGFYEQEVARQVLQFGDLAHVWSTYVGRRAPGDPQPFLRGINSIQLVREGGRWWVAQIAWEQESDAGPIPDEFLSGK
ncbi:MAG: DUF2785 domain-containing protein [Planctomycetota bacterium]